MKSTELMSPSAFKLKCPSCNGEIPQFDVVIAFGGFGKKLPFRCPTCDCSLCVSAVYSWSVVFILSLLVFGIPTILKVRPWLLWCIVVVFLWIAISAVISVYVRIFFPPKILKYYPDDLSLNTSQRR
jgi:hypothetical protein